MPDWKQVLSEIVNTANQANGVAQNASDIIRRTYLGQLATHTGRNVIAYYSGWLAKQNIVGLEISDEDKNGFMMAVHGLDRTKGLDLILHTPGGGIAATQSLVDYLHKMFGTTCVLSYRRLRCQQERCWPVRAAPFSWQSTRILDPSIPT